MADPRARARDLVHQVGAAELEKTRERARRITHFDGADHSHARGSLVPSGAVAVSVGRSELGAWTAHTQTWTVHASYSAAEGSANLTATAGTQIQTSVRQYLSYPNVLTFHVTVPQGARATNSTNRDLPIVGFPSIDLSSVASLGYAAFQGLWPSPVVGQKLTAFPKFSLPRDGPVVFTTPRTNSKSSYSLLFGPVSDPITTVHTIDKNALRFGLSQAAANLPAQHTMSTVAVFGPGMQATMKNYGEILAKVQGAGDISRAEDPILTHLSAWTDNGAFYYWNAAGQKVLPKPGDVLPHWLSELRKNGVNVASLQLDGWWPDNTHSIAQRNLFTDWPSFFSAINQDQPTNLMLCKSRLLSHVQFQHCRVLYDCMSSVECYCTRVCADSSPLPLSITLTPRQDHV